MARGGPQKAMKNPPKAKMWRIQGEEKAGFSGERYARTLNER